MNEVNANSTPHFLPDQRSEKLGLIKEVKSFSPVEPYFSFPKQLCQRMSNNEEPYLLKVEVCSCYYPSSARLSHPKGEGTPPSNAAIHAHMELNSDL